ncbi:MAG TPA: carboxypeptidase-like regulatory domain-containing protein, partial [Chitinophagaceae bacterium]|nr:carboxypeptidase-like regulatory domain-containing protein [Chitinophagaceae bacterium]
MKKKFLYFLLLFIIPCLGAYNTVAQGTTITGKITAEDGTAVPGVTIVVKGTKTGASSNNNGEYTITASKPPEALVYSSIGFNDQEIAVKGQSVIDVKMTAANTKLNDVVVIGYGTQRQKDVTGSVS